MADHTDQYAIISEKLKMLKISSLKAELKRAVIGFLNSKDLMTILPTGFGKSVIFELFTLVKMHENGLTSLAIVSPLAFIMEDQIKDFEDLGISAAKLRCDEKTLEKIAGGKYRVNFGCAEAVLDERFRNVLKDVTKPFHSLVKLIVVDECHTVETCCMVWASYGVVKGDDALVPVNVIGMITQVLFTLCFFLYCKERGKEVKAVVYAAVLACSLYMYVVHFLSNDQTRVRHLGLICIVLTIIMQASPLATVAKVVQTRSTESMPFIFSFMMVLVSFLWLSYGTVVEDINIQVPNATGVFLGVLQLSLFCIYPSKPTVNVKL